MTGNLKNSLRFIVVLLLLMFMSVQMAPSVSGQTAIFINEIHLCVLLIFKRSKNILVELPTTLTLLRIEFSQITPLSLIL